MQLFQNKPTNWPHYAAFVGLVPLSLLHFEIHKAAHLMKSTINYKNSL